MVNTFKPDNIAKHNDLLDYSVFVAGRRHAIATKKDHSDEAHCQYVQKRAVMPLTNYVRYAILLSLMRRIRPCAYTPVAVYRITRRILYTCAKTNTRTS
jgi:hypothetical protein